MGALKSIAGIMTAIMVLAVLAGVVAVIWFFVSRNHALVQAQQQAAHATIGEAQAQTAQAAQTITTRGEARERQISILRTGDRAAIAAAPGASMVVPDTVGDVVNRRLCLAQNESDFCGGISVLPDDPAELPDAVQGPGNSSQTSDHR